MNFPPFSTETSVVYQSLAEFLPAVIVGYQILLNVLPVATVVYRTSPEADERGTAKTKTSRGLSM